MSEKIKEIIKSNSSDIHNGFVGKEKDRLKKIREDLEEQKEVKK